MSETSSLYSSTYSDVYTYGGDMSEYDHSYYNINNTSNPNPYSYNPDPYSTYDYGESNESPYNYGRTRSYSTGSIYPSDYYERKNYFNTSDNQLDYSVNKNVKNNFATTQNGNKNNVSKNSENISSNSSGKNVTNTFNKTDYNRFLSSNPLFLDYKEKYDSDIDKSNISQSYSSYGFTNDFNPTYQYSSNYSFGAEGNQEEQSNTETSQLYSNKYNLYNYSSLYADSSMGNMYDGYDNMNSSMLNDTNAFF